MENRKKENIENESVCRLSLSHVLTYHLVALPCLASPSALNESLIQNITLCISAI